MTLRTHYILYLTVILVSIPLLMLSRTVRAADSQTITFNIEVPAFTCTVTPIAVNYGGAIIGATAVGKNWPTLAPQDLRVQLANCTGTPLFGKTPTLTIAKVGSTTVTQNYVFRDPGSTAKGWGVAIFNKPAASITQNATTNMVADGGIAWTGTLGSIPTNQTITLATAVTCGALAECTAAKLGTGSVKATITFNLAYP